MTDEQVERITNMIAQRFETFGGGGIRTDDFAIESSKERPIRFVSGVKVEDIVRLVGSEAERDQHFRIMKALRKAGE